MYLFFYNVKKILEGTVLKENSSFLVQCRSQIQSNIGSDHLGQSKCVPVRCPSSSLIYLFIFWRIVHHHHHHHLLLSLSHFLQLLPLATSTLLGLHKTMLICATFKCLRHCRDQCYHHHHQHHHLIVLQPSIIMLPLLNHYFYIPINYSLNRVSRDIV